MKKKKLSPKQFKVRSVMREFKSGKLNSSSGRKVKSRKQAIAIALSEASRAGFSCLGDFAEFGRGPDKRPLKRRMGQDASRVGSAAIAGASIGALAPVLVPRKVGFVNKALTSKAMGRVPGIGRGLRRQAIKASKLPLNQNPAAVTAGALGSGALGVGYGLNQVRRDRRKSRMAARRR